MANIAVLIAEERSTRWDGEFKGVIMKDRDISAGIKLLVQGEDVLFKLYDRWAFERDGRLDALNDELTKLRTAIDTIGALNK